MNMPKHKKMFIRIISCLSALFVLLTSTPLWNMPKVEAENEAGLSDVSQYEETVDFARVGIVYSTSVKDSYTVYLERGIEYGIQNELDHSFYKISEITGKEFSVIKDQEVAYLDILSYKVEDTSGEETETNPEQTAIETSSPETSSPETSSPEASAPVEPVLQSEAQEYTLEELMDLVVMMTDGEGVTLFWQYSGNGDKTIRIGGFADKNAAEAYLSVMREKLTGTLEAQVTEGEPRGLLLTAATGEIICGYTSEDNEYALALKALPVEGQDITYITNSSREYEGTFEFRRFIYGTAVDGVEVINVVPMQKYLACVTSYEIYPSWPHESHKTFIIVARTYFYSFMTAHKSQHFNMCCDTHCQVYRGSDRLNESMITAAEETKGLVLLASNGKVAKLNFSDSAGGCTVASHETWQSSVYDYLVAVPTPWEKYKSNTKSNWTVEFTPNELYKKVRSKCTNLKGDIKSVSVTLCTDSPHIYSIEFTDIHGNKDMVERATQVRTLLGLNSSNFVVGKAGETVGRTVYSLDTFESIYSPDFKGAEGIVWGDADVVLSKGETVLKEGSSFGLVGAGGTTEHKFQGNGYTVVMSDKSLTVSETGLPDILNAKPVKKTEYVTLEGTEGSFVFSGIGWGHGVGLSQRGTNDLIELGYDCETILLYYFPNTKIVGANTIE